jgi:hypothetical protein
MIEGKGVDTMKQHDTIMWPKPIKKSIVKKIIAKLITLIKGKRNEKLTKQSSI